MKKEKISMEDFLLNYQNRPEIKVLSSTDVLTSIWEHEKNVRGIDWIKTEKGESEALLAAVKKAQLLNKELRKLFNKKVLPAINMEIIRKDGAVTNNVKIFKKDKL